MKLTHTMIFVIVVLALSFIATVLIVEVLETSAPEFSTFPKHRPADLVTW